MATFSRHSLTGANLIWGPFGKNRIISQTFLKSTIEHADLAKTGEMRGGGWWWPYNFEPTLVQS
jgi:hypothetical protein